MEVDLSVKRFPWTMHLTTSDVRVTDFLQSILIFQNKKGKLYSVREIFALNFGIVTFRPWYFKLVQNCCGELVVRVRAFRPGGSGFQTLSR